MIAGLKLEVRLLLLCYQTSYFVQVAELVNSSRIEAKERRKEEIETDFQLNLISPTYTHIERTKLLVVVAAVTVEPQRQHPNLIGFQNVR